MKDQRGQVLLLVVLTMVVALTVGLSIASRIVAELKISKQNEESQRAFQAAEAGIQQQLRQTSPIVQSLGNNASFSTELDTSTTQGMQIDVNAGIPLDQDSGADVWLSIYNPDPSTNFSSPMSGSADIYWGSTDQVNCSLPQGSTIIPAIEVAILEGPTNTPSIKKYVYDDAGCGRLSGSSGATTAGGPFLRGNGVAYRYKATIDFNNGLVMKVIPIYNSTIVRVESSGSPFPSQGKVVISTGTSGETARKIRYYTSLPQLPIEVFPYSIISQ